MSDIKLFSINTNNQLVTELVGKYAALEKDLQVLLEANMETFLGVRLIKTEHTTGKTHSGRIDSLGLDENGCPVIIEYKRHSNENVINQGLFYLDWLLDHQAEFQLLVMDKLGREVAEDIEWNGTRLICIASDFNKYDEHAVQQMNRNIELMRYRYFGDDLLLLELVNAQTANTLTIKNLASTQKSSRSLDSGRKDTHDHRKAAADKELTALYDLVCDYALSLGDEVQRKELKFYTAFKRIKNFASVQVWAPVQDPSIRLYLKLDPRHIVLQEGLIEDVSKKGHWGTGDLEVQIKSVEDFEKTKSLIELSYQEN
ncbi:DUF5655 domain-containing protein [Eionea flava]